MAKITLTDPINVVGAETSFIAAEAANNALIEAAVENTLSRDGTGPNSMNSDLDMNNNDINNCKSINATNVLVGGVAVLSGGASTAGLQAFASRTTLQAEEGANHPTAYLSESGREGVFIWSSTNLSAEVTSDTQEALYLPPGSDSTGASGAWVRAIASPLNVKWFGAVPDDSATAVKTANTTAFNAMFEYLRTDLDGAGSCYVPLGTYYTNGSINATDIRTQMKPWELIFELGARIWSHATGKVALDFSLCRNSRQENVMVVGDYTDTPTIGILHTAGNDTFSGTGENLVINERAFGKQTMASGYNFGTEVTTFIGCCYRNGSTSSTAYSWVDTGGNILSAVSDFATLPAAALGSTTMGSRVGHRVYNVDYMSGSKVGAGPSVLLEGLGGVTYENIFTAADVATDVPITIDLTNSNIRGLTLKCHLENDPNILVKIIGNDGFIENMYFDEVANARAAASVFDFNGTQQRIVSSVIRTQWEVDPFSFSHGSGTKSDKPSLENCVLTDIAQGGTEGTMDSDDFNELSIIANVRKQAQVVIQVLDRGNVQATIRHSNGGGGERIHHRYDAVTLATGTATVETASIGIGEEAPSDTLNKVVFTGAAGAPDEILVRFNNNMDVANANGVDNIQTATGATIAVLNGDLGVLKRDRVTDNWHMTFPVS
jgi:hypothetical protein